MFQSYYCATLSSQGSIYFTTERIRTCMPKYTCFCFVNATVSKQPGIIHRLHCVAAGYVDYLLQQECVITMTYLYTFTHRRPNAFKLQARLTWVNWKQFSFLLRFIPFWCMVGLSNSSDSSHWLGVNSDEKKQESRNCTAKHFPGSMSRLRSRQLQRSNRRRRRERGVEEKRGFSDRGLPKEVVEIYITACCSTKISLQSREVQGWENGKHAL